MLLKTILFITFTCGCLSSLLVGVVTKDAVIISSSNAFTKNGVTMRGDFDWIRQVGDHCFVGVQGDSSDCEYLLTQLESSNRDHVLTFGRSLPSGSVAHLCRRIIAKFLRSNQLKVSVLIAGWNSDRNCPTLFWLDSIGLEAFFFTFVIIIRRKLPCLESRIKSKLHHGLPLFL